MFISCIGIFNIVDLWKYKYIMENLLLTMSVVLISFLFLMIGIAFYQISKIEKVYRIRRKWLYSDDSRYYKYSCDEMINANSSNLFGLKYPNEKDFK